MPPTGTDHLLVNMGTGGFQGAAAECDYFDQADMIADFRALASMPPEQYRPQLTEPYDPELPG